MKTAQILVFTFLLLCSVQAQESILKIPYSSLKESPRITNSGIYAVSSFSVSPSVVTLKFFNSLQLQQINQTSVKKTVAPETPGISNALVNEVTHEYKLIPDYTKRAAIVLKSDVNIQGNKNTGLYAEVPDRNTLLLYTDGQQHRITFPANLACAEIIGRSSAGYLFITAELYSGSDNYSVVRKVMVLNPSGSIVNTLVVPEYRYLSMLREFFLDSHGNLYHFLSGENTCEVLMFAAEDIISGKALSYPERFNKVVKQTSFLPVNEPATASGVKAPPPVAYRNTAVRMGETYVLHRYQCSSGNLVPAGVTAPDGDRVQTPSWLVTGANGRVAYKWGGFNTLAEYTAGLAAGKYAGDIHTSGVSSYAVGVDCSGFLSRCWQLSYHSSTADMPGITTQYSVWDSLKPGDAIHKVGHVRMFINRTANGMFRVVESSGRDWSVSYWTYTVSELADYTPRRLNTMQDEYNLVAPKLLSAMVNANNTLSLKWVSDTTGVLGYRVYESVSGVAWVLVADETTVRNTSLTIPFSNKYGYFRIAAVTSFSGTSAEGNFSNLLPAGNYTGGNKVLLVDGYDRDNGSYRGAAYPYLMYYAKVLAGKQISFQSVKSSELTQEVLASSGKVYFCLADESSENAVLSGTEQTMLKQYLQSGGKLFISGSEIGWGLSARGTTADKDFYEKILHARYKADNSASKVIVGAPSTFYSGLQFQIGQMYDEDFPDDIDTAYGSVPVLKYGNNKTAGIAYSGLFDGTGVAGRLIYLAFPLETTASDTAFTKVIEGSLLFFDGLTSAEESDAQTVKNNALQLYPNPSRGIIHVVSTNNTGESYLLIYNANGAEVKRVKIPAGKESVIEVSNFPAGVYLCREMNSGKINVRVAKLVILK